MPSVTKQDIESGDIESGGADWILLNENEYPNYHHPAYKNIIGDFVVDSSGTPSGGWMLMESSSAYHEDGVEHIDKVLHNEVTGETITADQLNDSDWVLLTVN